MSGQIKELKKILQDQQTAEFIIKRLVVLFKLNLFFSVLNFKLIKFVVLSVISHVAFYFF